MPNQKEPTFFVVVDAPRFSMVESSYDRAGPAMARKLELERASEDPVRVMSEPELAKARRRARREGRVMRHTRPRRRVPNPRNSLVKDALRAEAVKYKKFDGFAEAYWNDCARGLYWTSTDDSRFHIGSPERKAISKKKFFVYCNPEQALEAVDTKYVAELDVTGLPKSYIGHTRGGKGTEIRITGNPGAIKVLRVLKADKAIRSFKYQQGILPSSRAQLFKFWEAAWRKEKARLEKEASRQKRLRQKEIERERKMLEEQRERAKKEARAKKKSSKKKASKQKSQVKKKISEAEAKARIKKAEEQKSAGPKRKAGAKTPKQKKAEKNPVRSKRISAYRNDG